MSINEYPLLIISPSEFIRVLFPLQEHKRNSGMPCLLVTLEDIQKRFDVESLAEAFLVKHEHGAIAYMGSVAKREHGGKALQKYFTEFFAVQFEYHILGNGWLNAMKKFLANEALPGMGYYYAYLHLHKVILFGDPSLRIGGIPHWQKHHFTGEWEMAHDGWKGLLKL